MILKQLYCYLPPYNSYNDIQTYFTLLPSKYRDPTHLLKWRGWTRLGWGRKCVINGSLVLNLVFLLNSGGHPSPPQRIPEIHMSYYSHPKTLKRVWLSPTNSFSTSAMSMASVLSQWTWRDIRWLRLLSEVLFLSYVFTLFIAEKQRSLVAFVDGITSNNFASTTT